MKKILAILLTLTYFSVMSVLAAGEVSFVAKADNVVHTQQCRIRQCAATA